MLLFFYLHINGLHASHHLIMATSGFVVQAGLTTLLVLFVFVS